MSRLAAYTLGLWLSLCSIACGQAISDLPAAALPLTGNELFIVSQPTAGTISGFSSRKVTLTNVFTSPSFNPLVLGSNGGASGQILLNGSTSGSTQLLALATGQLQINNAVTITETVAGRYGLLMNVSGANTGGLGIGMSATGSPLGGNGLNLIDVNSDNQACGTNNVCAGFLVSHTFGGAALTGNRAAFLANGTFTAASGNTPGDAYVALGGSMTASANDGGTGTTFSTAQGILGGANPIGLCNTGATNWFVCQGAEIDLGIATGASAYGKEGLLIAHHILDRVQGSVFDCALCIADSNNGQSSWVTGVQFGMPSSFTTAKWPLNSSSTAIGCVNCGAVGTVLDFSGATPTNFGIKLAGFSTGPTGAVAVGANGGTAGQVTLEGSASGGALLTATSTGGLSIQPTSGAGIAFNDGAILAMQVLGVGATGVNSTFSRNAATGAAPVLGVVGGDTNINLWLSGKGTGGIGFVNVGGTTAFGSIGGAGLGNGQLLLNGNTSGTVTLATQASGGGLAIDGPAPSSCTVTGAGSSATCTFTTNSNINAGAMTIVPGGTGITSSGTLTITVTAWPGSANPSCIAQLDNSVNSWSASGLTQIEIYGSTTAEFGWANGGTALTSGDTYRVGYICWGK